MRALMLLAVLASPAAAQQAQWSPPPQDLIDRARALLRTMPLVDGHNDLPTELLSEAGGDPANADIAMPQPQFHTDLPRLEAGGVGAQFWSAYVTIDSIPVGGSMREAMRQIDMVHRLVDRYAELEFARTADDIERIHGSGRIASLIGLEGGHAIEGTLSALRQFHALGVRYMTLTHNASHDWADAASDFRRHGGLTEFGENVVREMNRLGMFVDLSHVSPETMRDALRASAAPVIFSHSSARAIVDHPRNVPDDVLQMLRENGGVVMITFVPGFIARGSMEWEAARDSALQSLHAELDDAAEISRRLAAWTASHPAPVASVADVADHIEHARRVAGVDHVGIGSDFDGISSTPVGLEDVSTFPVLFAELLRRGWSEEDLRKLAGGNLLRAMRAMEAVAVRLAAERPPAVGPGR